MANVGRQLVFLLFLAGSALAARPGDFKVLGPGGGGAMFNPTISPHDPNTVLVSCDMTGAYITHDGGQSWRMFNLRGVVHFFVFDPLDAMVIYAQTSGVWPATAGIPKTLYTQASILWRSTDAGESWKIVYPKPEKIKAIVMKSDHADEDLVVDSNPLGIITALAIDPGNSKTLYAAAASDHIAFFVSHDWGESWERRDALPETARRIWVDPKSPQEARILFIVGQHTVSVKCGQGLQNLPVPESVTFTDTSAGFNFGPQPIIYGVSDKGISISKDGGRNWQQSERALGRSR